MKKKYLSNIIAKMTLEQKIGSVLTLGFTGTVARQHIYDYINKYHCGGLRLTPRLRTFGSYIDPKSGKTIVNLEDDKGYKKGVNSPSATVSEYKKILDEFQEIAMSRPLGIPLHFSYDQEGGTSADIRFAGVRIFPKPMGIRATGDSKLAYEVAKAVARQSRAIGFNWVHSPVLDVNVEPLNPEIYTRAYSDIAQEVAEYSIQSCKGFKDVGVIATGKHFPGRGDSPVDAHYELPIINVDKDTLWERELLPYRELIKQKLLPSIMLAHSIFPAIDEDNVATVSKKIVTGLLRDKMGFNGVITTDSMTMGALATRYGVANACAMSLEAGADLVLMKAENSLVDDVFKTIKQFVVEGRIAEAELNEKVYRILNVKHEYGLFSHGNNWSERPEEAINDSQIISLSKLVAKKSVLIEKNNDNILPFPKDKKILIVEQINNTPNNSEWHPGLLFKNCMKYNKNVSYLEVSYTFDEEDKERIKEKINDYDFIILTNYFIRGNLTNNEFIDSILREKSRNIIVITNTPYALSIPKEAENVIITFATSPDNIEVVAGVLFGEILPEGEMPISNAR
jgi:beta-N-acetylhexosaminidase